MDGINPLTASPVIEQANQLQEGNKIKDIANNLSSAAKGAGAAKGDAKLKNACEQFEAMFLDLMFQEMRKTVPKDKLWGDSNADDILRSMYDTELTKNMAQAGGVGLADMLYRQIKKQDIKPPLTDAVKAYRK